MNAGDSDLSSSASRFGARMRKKDKASSRWSFDRTSRYRNSTGYSPAVCGMLVTPFDRTTVHPREVFSDALTDRAAGIIVAHNHPAGSYEPSAFDIEVTKQLKAAGTVMGIALLDHVIFNRSGYFSFLEAGRL